MRNKFLKGLSVAFAAAMAFTVVAPALTTEAASAKATVVTKKTVGFGQAGNNKITTEYTYDSRGRVVKEVETSTVGSYDELRANKTPGAAVTTTTEIKVGNETKSYTAVVETPYDYSDVATAKNDVKVVTTTNYTYYNSGAKKDQKKSASTTTEETQTISYISTVEDATYAYVKARVSTKDTTYTYDSKGRKTQEVSVEKGVGAYNPATRAVVPNYTYASLAANKVGNVTYNDAFMDNQNRKSALNDIYIIEDKKVFTNDSKGQALSVAQTVTVGNHDETWDAANENKTGERDTVIVANGKGEFTYNKNGFPTKFVKTTSGTSVVAVINGPTTTNVAADTVETFKYTYGKDMQLSKKTVTAKGVKKFVQATVATNNDASASAGAKSDITTGDKLTTVWVNNAGAMTATNYDSVTFTNNVVYGDPSTDTYTYSCDLKEGTTVKTSELRFKDNGTTSDQIIETKYAVKKISVPSSRATGVMKEQFLAQTDFDF